MICHYHELTAMVGVSRPGARVVLNDLHKAAWSLYTGTGEMTIPKGIERPFTFRWDAVPGRPGVYLMTVRSPFPFANAQAKAVDMAEGQAIALEVLLSPFIRMKNAQGKPRRVMPLADKWEEVVTDMMGRRGIAVDTVSLSPPERRVVRHHREQSSPIMMATIRGHIQDGAVLADFWLRGATPMRAYGLGQMTLLPDSAVQAQTITQ